METRQLLMRKDSVTTPSANNMVHQRVLVRSKDGTRVPLSLVYRDDVCGPDDPHCAILVGYGAYGEHISLAYDPTLQPLLDRGYIVAYAHTRGGGELGRTWHDQGRGRHKMRAIEDYLACANALLSGGIPELTPRPVSRLIAKAFSAGGIIVGAAVNQQPELFQKVVLTNAFLDLDATMRQPSLHLTEHEWEEYGNPLVDPTAANAIAAICPVLTVKETRNKSETPQVQFLIIGTYDDESVPVHNAMVYGRQVRKKTGARVFLHFEVEGGHHLTTNRLRVATIEASFIVGSDDAAMQLDAVYQNT